MTKEVTVVMSTPFNNNPSPSSPAFDPKEGRVNGERSTINKLPTECRDLLGDPVHKRDNLCYTFSARLHRNIKIRTNGPCPQIAQ